MQFSVGLEYSLHCLLYMVDMPAGKSIGIKELALYQGVSESYLSKVFTKLRKNGIVKSVPGVNGGYALARASKDISFWDVVEAIEGTSPLFQCSEIRQNEILLDKENMPDSHTKCPCLIKVVMQEGEQQMKTYLEQKTLAWLYSEVDKKVPADHKQATLNWFKDALDSKGKK